VSESPPRKRRERDHGVFNRSIELATPIDADKISAKLENGVLTVTLPKAERLKPRKIEVAAG
jgi:HSP20 family protein